MVPEILLEQLLDQSFEQQLKTSAQLVYQVLLNCGMDPLLQEIQLQEWITFRNFWCVG